MADVNANIDINIDSSNAVANLRRLELAINDYQRNIASANTAAANSSAALNRALVDGINNTGMFSAKIAPATDSVGRFTTALEKNKLSLGEYTKYAASQLPGLSRVFRREFDTMQQVAESRVKKMQTQYLALGQTIDGTARSISMMPRGLAPGYATDVALATQRHQMLNKMIDDGSTKLLNWGKNTQWAGRQLMVGFSIPLAALGVTASKTFMEIDKATTSLKRVYGDLSTTSEEVNKNIAAINALGKEYTKYGIALSDTVNVAATAAAAGMKNEQLTANTKESLRLATLGQIDYQQALTTTITLQNAFGTSNKELAPTVDFIGAVANQTVLSVDDLTQAIPRVAPVIKGLGGDVKDLAVLLVAMREGGVSAEQGANALKSGLANLINPTKSATEATAKYGISLQSIIETNKGDIMGTIKSLASALSNLDEFSRQQVLEKVFGKYQFARIGALFDHINEKTGQVKQAMDLLGMSTQDLSKVSEKSLTAISESTSVKFKATLEQLKISIAPLGQAFLKGITPIVSMVSKVADAFNNLPDGVKNVVAVIIAAVAGLGPVILMSVGLLANGFANIVKVIQVFRKGLAGIRGDADSFKYLSTAEIEAAAATDALEGSVQSLTGKLLLQKGAVSSLTQEYLRFIDVAGVAAAVDGIGGFGGIAGGMPTRGAAATRGASKAAMRMATGGIVPGTGSGDTIPALLTPGESVITKEATQKYAPILHEMNKGTLPGFAGGLIGKTLSSLMTTRSGIPGITRGRIPLLQKMTDIAASRGIRPMGGRMLDPSKPPTLERGEGTYAAVAITKGHVAPKIQSGNGDAYHPGLMFWQGKEVNHLLSKSSVTGQQILSDFKLLEKSGVYPPSLMISAARKLGLKEETIDAAYAELKKQLRNKRDHIFKDSDFLDFAGKILYEKMDKDVFSTLFNIGTLRSKGKSVDALTYDQFKQNHFSLGGISIGQALRTWQTSSRQVRENPELLAAIMGGMQQSSTSRTLHRSTTLGLGRGSEFNPQESAILFEALRSGNVGSLVGREFSIDSPVSYTAGGLGGTLGALAQNTDVNRINSLINQLYQRKNRRADDLKLLEKARRNFDAGIMPDLNEKRIKELEQKTEKTKYLAEQKRLQQQIKELAPRGYQNVVFEQRFPKGSPLLDVNAATGGAGTYMGQNVAHEQEFISPGSRVRVVDVQVDPKTGLTKIITEALPMKFASGGIVPGTGNKDTIPALLTPGESVINKKATQKYAPILHQMNQGTLRGFALGDEDIQSTRRYGSTTHKALKEELMSLPISQEQLAMELERLDRAQLAAQASAIALEEFYIRQNNGMELTQRQLNAIEQAKQVDRAHAVAYEGEKYSPENWTKDMWQIAPRQQNAMSQSMAQSPRNQEVYFAELEKMKLNEEEAASIRHKIVNDLQLTDKELIIQNQVLSNIVDKIEEGTIKQHQISDNFHAWAVSTIAATEAMFSPELLKASQKKEKNDGRYIAPGQYLYNTKLQEEKSKTGDYIPRGPLAALFRENGAIGKDRPILSAGKVFPSRNFSEIEGNPIPKVREEIVKSGRLVGKSIADSLKTIPQSAKELSAATQTSITQTKSQSKNIFSSMASTISPVTDLFAKQSERKQAATRKGTYDANLRAAAGKASTLTLPRVPGIIGLEQMPSQISNALKDVVYNIKSGDLQLKEGFSIIGKDLMTNGKILSGNIKTTLSETAQKVSLQLSQAGNTMKDAMIGAELKIREASAKTAGRISGGISSAGNWLYGKEGNELSRSQKFGNKAMGASMALGMASMLPMMLQDKNGKALGMDAGKLSMTMMGGSAILGILPMLGPAAVPVAALAGAAAIAGVSLNKWRSSLDDAAKDAATLGSNMGGAANAVGRMADILGATDPLKARQTLQLAVAPKQQEEFSKYSSMLQEGAGKQFIEELQAATSEERFSKLSSYLKNAIAAGMLNEDQAKLFSKAVGFQLNDVLLGIRAGGSASGQKTGSAALLELARQRENAVSGNGRIKSVINSNMPDSVNSADAAFAIGAGTQISQAYSEAAAKANEDYKNGIITFKELTNTVNETKIAISKWGSVVQKATQNTDDTGATAQGTQAAMALAGVTEDQRNALQDVYNNAYKTASENTSGAQMQFLNKQGTSYGKAIGSEAGYKYLENKATGAGYEANMQGVQAYMEKGGEKAQKDLLLAQKISDQLKLATKNDALQSAMNLAVSNGMINPSQASSNLNAIVNDPKALEYFNNAGQTAQAFTDALSKANSDILFSSEEYKNRLTNLAISLPTDELRNSLNAYVSSANSETESKSRLNRVVNLRGAPNGRELQAQFLNNVDIANQYGYNADIIQSRKGFKDILGLNSFGFPTDKNSAKNLANYNKSLSAAGQAGLSQGAVNYATEKGGKNASSKINNLISDYQKLMAMPEEVRLAINIDTNKGEDLDKFGPEAEKLTANWNILQNLNPNIDISLVAKWVMTDGNGNALDPAETTLRMLKLNKAMDQFNKSGKKGRYQASVDIVTALTNEGKSLTQGITPEDVVKDVEMKLAKIGKKLSDLTPEQASAVFQIDVSTLITGADIAAKAAEITTKMTETKDVGDKLMYARELEALTTSTQALNTDTEAAMFAAATTPTSSGSGGGGGSADFRKQLIKDTQANTNLFVKAKGAPNGLLQQFKNDFKKKAGFNLPQTILDQIGVGVEGEKNLTLLKKMGIDKFVAFIKKYLKSLAGQASAAIDDEITANNKKVEAIRSMKAAGYSEDQVQAALASDSFMQELDAMGNTSKGAQGLRSQLDRLTASQKAVTDASMTAEQALQNQRDAMQKDADIINNALAKQEDQIKIDNAAKFLADNGMTTDQMHHQIDANNKIIQQEQDKINAKQSQIDSLNRQNELNNRISDALSHDLDIMSQQEQKIRETYQKRIDALNKVAEINDHIAQQQQDQIGFAKALSEGDVYAAAQAAQQMQQNDIQYARKQQQDALQTGMQNEVDNLKTPSGLTKKQAEQQINAIKEQSYQISLRIRSIQDEIYTIQNGQMKTLQDQNEQYSRKLQYNDEDLNWQLQTADFQGHSRQWWIDHIAYLEHAMTNTNGLGDATQRLVDLMNQYNAGRPSGSAGEATSSNGLPQQASNGQSFSDMTGTDIGNLTGSDIGNYIRWAHGGPGAFVMATGGMVPRYYASGGHVNMDSVPAMLTPGEFVMRKAAVHKYGIGALSDMNTGRWDVPKYNTGKLYASAPNVGSSSRGNMQNNISAPVYNTYSINVPVNQPGASADEIASKVMMKIKNIENSSIRRIGGY